MNALEETIYCLVKECKPEEFGKALAIALNKIDSEGNTGREDDGKTPKKFSVDVLATTLSHIEKSSAYFILNKLEEQ